MPAITFPDLIQVKAPEGTAKALKEAAREEGKTASELVREILRTRLRERRPEQPVAGD